MQVLNNELKLDTFLKKLHSSNNRILMLDYDGTLAPFQSERNKAYPYPEVTVVLNKIILSKINRVIIISGRPIDDLKSLMKLDSFPEMWGCHGLEKLTPDGSYTKQKLPDNVINGFYAVENWINENNLQNVSEKKASGFAFHWRSLSKSKAKQINQQVTEKWQPIISDFSLSLIKFDKGIEIRPVNINKGNVVESILQDAQDNSINCYFGDDLTDEDAFNKLKGRCLRVLVRPVLRKTAADLWLKPPKELAKFLDEWL